MNEPWFRQKRFGYGTGWPIRWQGWALIAIYSACVAPAVPLAIVLNENILRIALSALVVALTIVLILISRAKIEGGWRWRI